MMPGEISINLLFQGLEIISILGGGGMVAYRLGRNSQAVSAAMAQQTIEISALKKEINELSKLVTEVAVQKQRLDTQDRRLDAHDRKLDELSHGEGFVMPLGTHLAGGSGHKP